MNLLIVEDDARVADFLLRGLRSEGYRIVHASTGPEGLELARAGEFQLVLLDVMLPGMSGIELCQILRAERNPVPVLMLTAMGRVEDRVSGLRCGADDYLTKPFAFDELLARIEALLRRPPQLRQRDTVLTVADLRFDRERMAVTRGPADAENRIALTAKELALLELLMSAPGRIHSRERILANVWGAHEDPLTNIVDVYIRRLRSKIDDGHAKPLIKTVRGLGYTIEA
jgi:DNA-binding response OmpR family regulator